MQAEQMENRLDILKQHLKKIDEVIENGPYKAHWDSLAFHKVPDWYKKAKFGIFIHWGVFSVPAYGSEWYPRWMYKEGTDEYRHHTSTYGPLEQFGYKDFIPMFKAENFNPAEWINLFKKAGAQFIMPVAEHHDGFQMYDSELSEWCASKKGPCKDILGLLKAETEKNNMTFTASSHRIEHYWFMGGMRQIKSDLPANLHYGDFYWPSYEEPFGDMGQDAVQGFDVEPLYMEDWLARTCEIVDKYRPKIMYFDWWIQVNAMKPYLKKFAAYYYNRALEWGEEVTINFKNDAFMFECAVRDIERGQLADISPSFWQNDTSVAKNSWCYTIGNDYKEPHEVICDLVDVVSKNGSLLLNIGPRADGTIPDKDKEILTAVGRWLETNGEGIYGSHYWKKYGEGPTLTKEGHYTDILRDSFTSEDFRFTYKNGYIYAFAMKWPEDGIVRIHLLGRKSKTFNGVIKNVQILGAKEDCRYMLCDEYLTVMAEGIHTKAPVGIKITID